ncbi:MULTISPECIES: hypothetical protein [Bacillaceae]|nr:MULTISPECIES: hypothetical protein [Bacillaceae]MDL0434698.1 hypothetical protein [Niallia sp. SS-2023]
MSKNEDTTSEGLNQIFEIINAKGDIGEIKKILADSNEEENSNPE